MNEHFSQLRKGHAVGSSSSERKDTKRIRKNLIEMTENIRTQVRAIEVLSHYEAALINKRIR